MYFVLFVVSPSTASTTRSALLCAALLVVAIFAAWSNSLGGPFVLDDVGNIADNPSIRDLSALGTVLHPPSDIGVGGRPILNLSFALNYAFTGLDLRALHLTNVLIHALSALTLFAFLRHTFLHLSPSALNAQLSTLSAAAAAALWALHPVHTQAVTYLSQRAESLLGLFYLLTLYCSARHVSTSPSPALPVPPTPTLSPALWPIAAVAACALGTATKEVMVTAPILVLLYDRCFVSGTFRTALRTRPRFYLALASTWILLAVLLADVGARGIGSDHGVTPFSYALTSCRTLVHYLCLSVWPHPLIFDYGADFVTSLGPVLPHAVIILTLLGATVFALRRFPRVGFAAAAFFLLLAPTTSVVPIAFSPVAESRLYLALAALVALVACAVHRFARHRTALVLVPLALLAASLTYARNRTYATDYALWADTAARRPLNPSAHYNLGLMHSRAGRLEAAITSWRTTLDLDPSFVAAHNNLANTLATLGRLAESVPHYEAALRLQPYAPLVRSNFSVILLNLQRLPEAEAQIRLSLRQFPASAAAHNNLGLVLKTQGRLAEEIAAYETALRFEPDFTDAHHNLALALTRAARLPEALAHLENVIRLRPGQIEPHLNLVRVLLNASHLPEALARAEATLRLFPTSPDAHLLHGNCLAYRNDFPAAVTAYERALTLRPDFPDARTNLEKIRARLPK